VALFHAAVVPEVLPSELSPREDHVPLSRPLAPLSLSMIFLDVSPEALSVLVSLPTPRASAKRLLFPQHLWSAFQRADAASQLSWTANDKLTLQNRFTDFEAFFPSRIRALQPEFPQTERPLLSWTLSPLECSPPTLLTLDPHHPKTATRLALRQSRGTKDPATLSPR